MQSTCLVSVRVMTHSVNTSAPAEHCESTDLTACAGVEGSDALPHPASAVQRVRVKPNGDRITYNRIDVYNREGYVITNRKENILL